MVGGGGPAPPPEFVPGINIIQRPLKCQVNSNFSTSTLSLLPPLSPLPAIGPGSLIGDKSTGLVNQLLCMQANL